MVDNRIFEYDLKSLDIAVYCGMAIGPGQDNDKDAEEDGIESKDFGMKMQPEFSLLSPSIMKG